MSKDQQLVSSERSGVIGKLPGNELSEIGNLGELGVMPSGLLWMRLSVSWFWTSWYIFSLVIPESHSPLSRCCIKADGEVKPTLHLFPTGQLRLLSGLCLTDSRCCKREFVDLKVRLQSSHRCLSLFLVIFVDSGFPELFAIGFLCARLAICALRAWMSLKAMLQSQQRNSDACI